MTVSASGPAQAAWADVGPRPNWLLTISFEISVCIERSRSIESRSGSNSDTGQG
jgi:hypothetical protein